MPTIETIIKGLPPEVEVLVKVPHYSLDVGRVYWKSTKVSKELILPMVNLLEDGADKVNHTKSKLQSELRDLRSSFEELEKEKAVLSKTIESLSKYRDKIEKAKDGFLSSFSKAKKTIV